MQEHQCASRVLMVRPAAFGYNPQTAASNHLQIDARLAPAEAQARTRDEFDALVCALRGSGIEVFVAQDTAPPARPDAVFPNNWVSFHEDGTVVLYPMQAANRRLERRPEIVARAAGELGFRVRRTVDLTHHESDGRFLEGTGSVVLDRTQRIAYACRSPRTHESVLEEWARELGYEPLIFDATDAGGMPYYHTNVMLSIGERCAIVGSEALAGGDRARVLGRLAAGGRELIEIDRSAVACFAANVLELASWDEGFGDFRLMVISASARRALDARSVARLMACTDDLLVAPVPTIEALGGGSVRCMLAEVFAP
ncbi:MAG: amidinotransferase [Gammaproteobacteria bacterium]|nr:amidinotransferase [Gammaproteobacteria bacterium]